MRGLSRLAAGATTALAMAASGAAAPVVVTRPDVHGCRLLVPQDLGVGTVEWVGGCPNGFAEGLGIIRLNSKTDGLQVFYGLMRHGLPVSGYLETGSAETRGPVPLFKGAQDGDYVHGRASDLRVCAIAARAADAAADHYRRQGKPESAKVYSEEAVNFRACDPRMGD